MTDLFSRYGVECAAGDFLFREGDPGTHIYVLQLGRVRIIKNTPLGEKVLGELGPGEFFGEMAIVNQRPRGASAQAVVPSKVIAIDGTTFEAMISSNTEIAVRLIRKLAERLDAADSLIAVLTESDLKSRVILGLLREVRASGELRGDGAFVPYNTEALARQWNMSVGDTADVVQRLERLGIVRSDTHGTHILSLARLQEFKAFLEAGS